jgi:hypothetical protein
MEVADVHPEKRIDGQYEAHVVDEDIALYEIREAFVYRHQGDGHEIGGAKENDQLSENVAEFWDGNVENYCC